MGRAAMKNVVAIVLIMLAALLTATCANEMTETRRSAQDSGAARDHGSISAAGADRDAAPPADASAGVDTSASYDAGGIDDAGLPRDAARRILRGCDPRSSTRT